MKNIMKKCLAILICLLSVFLLFGCKSGKEEPHGLAGKTFVYENDGFHGDFKITFKEDGTFTCYEGMASSYIGIGQWTVGKNTVTLTDELHVNVFEIGKGKLIWRADGSDNFSYVKVKNGEAFFEE